MSLLPLFVLPASTPTPSASTPSATASVDSFSFPFVCINTNLHLTLHCRGHFLVFEQHFFQLERENSGASESFWQFRVIEFLRNWQKAFYSSYK